MKLLFTKRILLFAIGVMAIISTSAFAYDDISGSVEGTVIQADGQPLPGVNIRFPQLNRGTSTNAQGQFSIQNIPTGSYVISFSYIGYATETRQVTINDQQTSEVNVTLNEQSLQIETITVTGTAYASDPLTSPADIDILAGSEKFAAQQTSLGASLEELSGVSTISTGTQTGKPVIRGLSGSRVRVLDDGTAMDFQQYGVRHGPNVDPFTAERIEVVRGAASVQYGSDALGGAVNVISNSIPDAINRKGFLDGELFGEYAANNEEWASGLHLEGASQGFGFTGTVIRRTSGNITVPDVPTFMESGDNSGPKFTGELDNTDYEQLNGSIGIGYQAGFGKITGEYTRWKNEHNFLLPNGLGLGQNLENDTYKLKGNFPLGNSFILKPQINYTKNLRQSNPGGDNAEPRSELPDDGPAFLDVLTNNYTSKLNMEHPSFGPFAGTVGLEYLYQDQTTRGTGEALVPSGTVKNFGAFIFEKAEWGDFTLSLGARIDARTQEAEPNETLNLPDTGESADVLDQNYTEFSGSIGGTYRLTEHFAIASNISRGFRAPSFFDLHVQGQHGGVAAFQIGDPDLEPERSLNTDLSLRWRSSTVSAKITGYRNAIQNYIFLVNTGEFAGPDGEGPPILQNTQGNARLLGLDASLQAQLAPWLQIDGTFETVKGENVDDNIEQVNDLPLLPATKIAGGVKFMQSEFGSLQNAYFKIGIEHAFDKKAAGRYEPFWQFGPAFPFGRASTDAYTLMNASIGFELGLWNRPISVNIRADNLLDEAYRDFLDTYKGYALSPGRSVSMRIKVPFGIL